MTGSVTAYNERFSPIPAAVYAGYRVENPQSDQATMPEEWLDHAPALIAPALIVPADPARKSPARVSSDVVGWVLAAVFAAFVTLCFCVFGGAPNHTIEADPMGEFRR